MPPIQYLYNRILKNVIIIQNMINQRTLIFFMMIGSFLSLDPVFSQKPEEKKDTFFLAKKKGLIGKLGKSISKGESIEQPVKSEIPYIKYVGRIIREIDLLSVGFQGNVNDTVQVKRDLGIRISNFFHKNTTNHVLYKNLFFKEGDRLFPYLIADNERHLREQVFLQDARIVVEEVPGSLDSVDVIVITKDVFSIGGSLNISNSHRAELVLKEENLAGSGSRVLVSGFYDMPRSPQTAFGAEFLRRNIKGSFINWSIGFQNYHDAFNSGRREESTLYSRIERPLISPYFATTGALEAYYNYTNDSYLPDSLYRKDKYAFLNFDGWYGYNFGTKKLLYKNLKSRYRKFIALRAFHQEFLSSPVKGSNIYDYRYANITGFLAGFTLFKQDFFHTNYIYGFGRNEDVPQGYNFSLIGGWTNKQNRKRPYYGVEYQRSHLGKKGFFSNYIARLGGFYYNGSFEDIDLLLDAEHFTRLKRLNSRWYNRTFYGGSITRQINPVLNAPLFLQTQFGLPYFDNGPVIAYFRSTVKTETVFYNTWKYLGFRMAPFVFADVSLLTPNMQTFTKSDGYTAIGAGVRTRNENLVFGTIELKAYYFPRTNPKMNWYKIEFNTNIRFKYNSTLLHRPEFVVDN